MSSFQLTAGAVPRCLDASSPGGFEPTLQVIGFREVSGKTGAQKRFRLIVSDGKWLSIGMLTTQLTNLIEDDTIKVNSVLSLKEYMINEVSGRRILIVLNCDVLGHADEKIGDPQKFKGGGDTKAPAAAGAAAGAPKAPLQANRGNAYSSSGGAASSSSSSSSSSRPAVSRSPDIGCVPVMQINPYANRWKIKGRVTNIANIRTWSNSKGDGKLFSFSIMDKNGDDIRGTFFNEGVDRFHPDQGGPDALRKGSVYTFQGGRVKVANAKWNDCKSEYEISFNANAEINECQDDGGVQRISYVRTTIARLEQLQADSRVDIVAVVQEAGPCTDFTSKKGKDLTKRELTLADDSGASVRCTLWGGLARTPDETFEGNPVVLITRCKVGEFGGRSLSSAFGGASQLEVNPSFAAETPHLQAWWGQGPGALHELTTGGGGGGAARGSIERRKVLNDIIEEGLGMDQEKADFINVKGYVTFVKHEKWCYPADPETRRKLTWDASAGKNGMWRNETDGKEYEEPMWSYCLQFQLQDYTGDRYVGALGNKPDRAEMLVGMTANELKRKVEHHDGSDPNHGDEGGDKDAVLDHLTKVLTFRMFNMCLMCKLDNREDEARTRANLHRVEPLEFATENKKLLDAIDEYDQF